MGRTTERTAKTRKSMGFGLQVGKDNAAEIRRLSSDLEVQSKWQMSAKKFIHAPAFENLMGIVIVSNIFVMVIDTDLTADQEDTSTSMVHWTEVFGWVVLFIFAAELSLRLFAFRRLFWIDGWNIFDFVIVCTDVTVGLMAVLFGKVFPVAMLRIFRLARLARVSKVLRVFPELRLLLASLLSSISAIFWGAVLLGLVLLVWSMAAVLFIHPLNKEIDYGGSCERCPRAYSSVMHSSLTFWQQIVTTDNWGEGTIPVIEKHPASAIFFIPLFLSVGMAVVSLILGMVVSVAQRAEAEIREVENAQEVASKFERQSNLLKHCKQMDVDNSGEVSQEELLKGFETPGDFRDGMEALGITRDDFDVVWAILDTENTGSISYKRLVHRLYALKTSDSQFTLAYLKYHITLIRDIMVQFEEKHLKEEEKIEEQLHRIENQEELLLERQEQHLEKLTVSGSDAPEGSRSNGLAKGKDKTKGSKILRMQGDADTQDTQDARERQNKGPESGGMPINEETSELAFVRDILTNLEDDHPAEIQGESGIKDKLQTVETTEKILLERVEQLLDKFEASVCNGHEKVDQRSEQNGIAMGQEASEAKGGEPQTRELLNDMVHAWQTDSNTKRGGSLVSSSAVTIDETQFLLKKVCCDVDRLLSEVKVMFSKVDGKLGAQVSPLAAMERDIITKEAQLELLVVPKKATSCSFCRSQAPTEIHALL